jgi:hypothetical protein
MKTSERLVALVNEALEQEGLPYRVTTDTPERIRAGYWQRAQGAGSWFVLARLPAPQQESTLTESTLTLIAFSTMSDCVQYGLKVTYSEAANEWQIDACTP